MGCDIHFYVEIKNDDDKWATRINGLWTRMTASALYFSLITR